MMQLSQLILARTNGSDDSTVDEQVGTSNEPCMLSQEEGGGLGYLVASAYALGCCTSTLLGMGYM